METFAEDRVLRAWPVVPIANTAMSRIAAEIISFLVALKICIFPSLEFGFLWRLLAGGRELHPTVLTLRLGEETVRLSGRSD